MSLDRYMIQIITRESLVKYKVSDLWVCPANLVSYHLQKPVTASLIGNSPVIHLAAVF